MKGTGEISLILMYRNKPEMAKERCVTANQLLEDEVLE